MTRLRKPSHHHCLFVASASIAHQDRQKSNVLIPFSIVSYRQLVVGEELGRSFGIQSFKKVPELQSGIGIIQPKQHHSHTFSIHTIAF